LTRASCLLSRGLVLHPPAACFVLAAEGQFDAALVLRRRARDHLPIGLADLPALLNRRPSAASALRWRPSTRQPEVSRSRRWASAGGRGRPKRSAPKWSSRLSPPFGPL